MNSEKKTNEFPFDIKEESHKNYFKHFDRIHDKLFTINVSVLAGTIAIFKNDLDNIKLFFIGTIVINLLLYGLVEFLLLQLYSAEYHYGITKKNDNFFLYIRRLSSVITISTVLCLLCFLKLIIK